MRSPSVRCVLVWLAIASGAGCRSAEHKPAPPLVPDVAVAGHASGQAGLRLILISDLEGVLEPCGCTSRPRGGVDRLAAAVSELRRGAERSLVLAAGDLFAAPRADRPARAQDGWAADACAAVLARLELGAVAVGTQDLAHAAARLATLSQQAKVALLGRGDSDPALDTLAQSALLPAGDVDVAAVAAAAPVERDRSGALHEGVSSVARQIEALRARGAKLAIAFVHADAEFAHALAESGVADLVVQSGVGGAAAPVSATPSGATLLLSTDAHGQSVLALDIWLGAGGGPWHVVTTPPAHEDERSAVVQVRDLDTGAASDPAVRALLDQVFARINAHNAEAGADTPAPAPRKGVASYVGSRACAACHADAYDWWQTTPHARAFETLVTRHRQLDLDCIGCHVTGYEQPGGASIGRLDELKGVGCESCHGPGSAHVDNPRLRGKAGRAIRREVPEAACVACHDREHSDLFAYVPMREHLLVRGHGANLIAPVTPKPR